MSEADPNHSSPGFEARRRVETLRAIYPLLSELDIGRPEALHLAARVASWPRLLMSRWMDAGTWPKIECLGAEHLHAARAEGRGVIVVPAHFGGYHWTSLALLHAGVPVSLLVDARNQAFLNSDVAQRMLPMYMDAGTFDAHGLGAFETIDSEDAMSLWRLRKAVVAGRAAVMFIDGNSGIDGRLVAKGSVRASLFGRDVWVRPGIAALAQATGAAIVPVVTHFDQRTDTARFTFEAPVEAAAGLTRKQARAELMRTLFAWLEAQILARPEQWEEWWLLTKWWVEPPGPASPSGSGLGSDRPASIRLPALAGRRLQVARPSLWRVTVEGSEAVVDLEHDLALTAEPALLDLFGAAERGDKVLAWVRDQDDNDSAKRALASALDLGLIRYQ
ncbi:lipid A biosynthesis lauroyl acyltransferase [Enhygromyxa salina]|uniref:Lipid A biosynthesis lauroyl acyltransferase n=1 Tax=Enhygromyxa salina TaxID=215803 RepID=A0A2S9YL49_9BACT|nr:hypothetical protein [Enhygromyxa salina]PRQ05841.1 lipid A biosynthesis lauroyl acyltransferase [Enhygromyxa salina]